MSAAAMCLVAYRELPPARKLVALALADNEVDGAGTIHAPMRAVQKWSGLGRPDICAELDALESDGIITDCRIDSRDTVRGRFVGWR